MNTDAARHEIAVSHREVLVIGCIPASGTQLPVFGMGESPFKSFIRWPWLVRLRWEEHVL